MQKKTSTSVEAFCTVCSKNSIGTAITSLLEGLIATTNYYLVLYFSLCANMDCHFISAKNIFLVMMICYCVLRATTRYCPYTSPPIILLQSLLQGFSHFLYKRCWLQHFYLAAHGEQLHD